MKISIKKKQSINSVNIFISDINNINLSSRRNSKDVFNISNEAMVDKKMKMKKIMIKKNIKKKKGLKKLMI